MNERRSSQTMKLAHSSRDSDALCCSPRPECHERATVVAAGEARPRSRNTQRILTTLGLPDELRERYSVESLLGNGSASAVYLARDRRSGKPVAIKFLRQTASPEQAERFVREGRMLASIDHPNVLKVHEVLPFESRPCLVVEYMRGGTLRDRLRGGDPLPVRDALLVMRQLLRGLEALHQRGIIHRDIKPDNILVGENGRIRIADLGIAKDSSDQRHLTQGGQILGSPDYMSPEQIRGARPGVATDLYAAGCVFYELLTGRPPFESEQLHELLRMHESSLPAPIEGIRPDLPAPVAALLGRMLAKEADDRPRSASECALQLAKAAPYSLRVTVGRSTSGAIEALRAGGTGTFARIPRLPRVLLAAVMLGLFSLPLLAF